MTIEKTRSITTCFYHGIYGFMQDHKLFGAWQRTSNQHIKAIRTHFGAKENASILYCGTATTRNPQNVYEAMMSLGINPLVTTLDLSRKPLMGLDRKTYQPMQANAVSLSFADRSFDYVTTDFLLSKMALESIILTIQEWGRVLNKDGLITTTTGVRQSDINLTNRAYDEITNRIYGIHFLPIELLRQIFYSAGLEVRFEKAKFDVKPFMYRYPDEFLVFIEAKPIKSENVDMVEKAKELIRDGLLIYKATLSDPHLRPLGFEEILIDLINNKFIVSRQENGELLGFIRIQEMSGNWYEIGSLYINPLYRNTPHHYGSSLLTQAVSVVKQKGGQAIVFSNNQSIINMLEKFGATKQKIIPMGLLLPFIITRLAHSKNVGDFISSTINKRDRSIYTLFAQ
ncbi:GNAT family N-acetyltransferase [Patescibacteria group bacterium]|nr:GNAT family N-acetyltransferase [Patescibacteria group bacterium]